MRDGGDGGYLQLWGWVILYIVPDILYILLDMAEKLVRAGG